MNAKHRADPGQRTTDRDKAVWLPAEPEPVLMGVYGAVADHYVVASAAACLVRTFGAPCKPVGCSS